MSDAAHDRAPAPRGARRILGRLAAALGAGGIFVASLLGGLYLHLDEPVTKRLTRSVVEGVLDGQLEGAFEVGAIETIAPEMIVVQRFKAFDPAGRLVIGAEQIRLRGAWLSEVLSFALRPRAELRLPDVRVERGEVALYFEEGRLSLADAFQSPRDPEAPPEPPAEAPPPPFAIVIDRIELGDVAVKGDLAPSVALDASVARVFASLRAGNRGVSLRVARTSLEERALLGAVTRGTGDYHLDVELRHGMETSVRMSTSFAGNVGPLELTSEARFFDGELTAVIDLPHVGPEQLKPWLPTSPLGRSFAARAGIKGRPPQLEIVGEVLVPPIGDEPPGKLAMRGKLAIAEEVLVDATVEAADLDARLFDASLPRTQLSARAQLGGRLAGSQSEIAVQLATSRSEVGGEIVPPLEGVAEIAQSGIATYLVAREPGMSLETAVRYRPDQPTEIAFRAEGANLAAVPRLSELLPGGMRGRARLEGLALVEPGKLDVTVDASAEGLGLPRSGLRVGSARMRARLSGPLDRLAIEASGHGQALTVEGQELESFRIDLKGPLARPTVKASARDRDRREIDARAVIDPEKGEATSIALEVRRDGAALSGKVRRVVSRGGRLEVQGVELEGLGGGLRGDLRVVRGELSGTIEGKKLDLDPLLRLAGVRLPYHLQGRADLSLALEPAPDGRNGSLRIAVEDARMLHFGGHAELLASFEGSKVRPQLVVRLEGNPQFRQAGDPCERFGTIVVAGEGEIRGALLDPKSWLEARAEGAAHLAGLKLSCVREQWPFLPVGELEGELDANVQLLLDPDQWLPSIPAFGLTTRGLVVAPLPPEPTAPPAWRSASLDLIAGGSFDGASGDTRLVLSAIDVRDPRPEPLPLAVIMGEADLDLKALEAGGPAADRSLETMPIALSLHAPRQPLGRLSALPAPWGEEIGGVDGDFQLDLELAGTPRAPSLAARLRGYDLTPSARVAGWDLRTDVDLMASYSAGGGRLDGAISRQGRTVATITGESRGDIGERLFGGHDERWTGWLEARLRALPLESLPLADPGLIQGEVSGRVRVDGLGDKPVLDVSLRVPELRIGSVMVFDDAVLQVRPQPERPGVVTLEAALPVRGSRERGLLVSAYGTVRWRDELFPRPDPSEPIGLVVVASDFPLETLSPFLGRSVGRVAGRVDGKVDLTIYRESEGQPAVLDVDLVLRDGLVQLPGLELREIEARIESKPGLIEVPHMAATIQTGRVTGKLSTRLRGLEPLDLHGTFVVPDDQRLPLSYDGVPLGAMSGEVNVSVQRTPNEAGSRDNLVRIDSPRLRLRLPAAAGKNLQPLEAHGEVSVSHALGPQPAEAAPDDGSQTTILVKLDDVEVEGGAELRIQLRTSPDDPPRIVVDGPATGRILLEGGELNLFGKRFTIDRGVVRLISEEVDNPHVNVTAHWNAPDGTVVFVDFIGQLNPLTGDKIRFRSSPPRSSQEIVSLLLLGEAPAAEIASNDSSDRAGALGQGVAAAQMNALLGRITPGLSTSIGTTDEGYVATTVTYQFSDEVSGSASFEQATGEVQSRRNDDPRTRFSVDWRFAPNFLVRGSVGVGEGATSGLDLLFQYRY